MVKQIPLTKGKFALVDDGDYERLMQWKWTYHNQGYAYRMTWPDKECILMHRLVMTTPDGLQTDHLNKNKLDNQRHNLRICHGSLNMGNTPGKGGTSKYKGVHFSKSNKRWVSQIKENGKTSHVGSFLSEEEAAIAYNQAAIKKYGDNYIYLNKVKAA